MSASAVHPQHQHHHIQQMLHDIPRMPAPAPTPALALLPPSSLSSSASSSLRYPPMPISREAIARIAAEDAEYGLRYVPPQPYLQMPLLPHFMPPLYSPTHIASSSIHHNNHSDLDSIPVSSMRPRSRIGGGARSSHADGSIASGEVSNRAAPSLHSLSASTPAAAVTSGVKGGSMSRAGLKPVTATPTKLKKRNASGTVAGTAASGATPTSKSTQSTATADARRALASGVASKRTTPPLQPQTIVPPLPPLPSIDQQQAAIRDESPAAHQPAVAPPASAPIEQPAAVAPPQKPLDEAELKSLVQSLLQDELSRVASLDASYARHARDLDATTALRRDLINREDEERQRRLEEESRRPNYYLYQARTEVEKLSSSLMPLLESADSALKRLYDHRGILLQSADRSLIEKLSAHALSSVSANADELGDLILDYLLTDTVETLNRIEQEKEQDRERKEQYQQLGSAWEVVEQIEREREEIRRRYQGGGDFDERKTKRSSVKKSDIRESSSFNKQGVHALEYDPPSARRTVNDNDVARQPSFMSSSLLSPTASSMTSSNVSLLPQPSTSIPTLSSHRDAATAAAAAAAAAAISSAASALPHSQPQSSEPKQHLLHPSVPLPCLPSLVNSVQASRAVYDTYLQSAAERHFLQPHQPRLDTIVSAAGDDILDELITQACQEVYGICDGYVERVFEAEFEDDLEQMIEQDVQDQMHEIEQAAQRSREEVEVKYQD